MYAVIALISVMLFTWAVAVWASYCDETSKDREEPTDRKTMLRKVA